MGRLLRKLRSWRQRRATRRRVRLQDFMGMSDRALADIGVRRADVHAALIGGTPLRRAAVTPEAARADAQVYELARQRRPAATDLNAAA